MKIIARTAKKESCSEDGVFWFREFAIEKIGFEYGLFHRYVSDVQGKLYPRMDGRTSLFGDLESSWVQIMKGKSVRNIINSYLGDSGFFGAESLIELHKRLVLRLAKINEFKEELRKRNSDLSLARGLLTDYMFAEQQKFSKKYKDKPDEEIAKAKKRTLQKIEPKIKESMERINSVRGEIKELEQTICRLEKER